MSAAGWTHAEAGADVEVRGWGGTRGEAFAQATLGVFAILIPPGAIQSSEQREVRAQADTAEALLAAWIEECLYVHEIEGFVARAVEMTVCTDRLAHGVLGGEPVDRDRHRSSMVKRATQRRALVTVKGGVHEAIVVVQKE
jgi:SHS2 domain-containing protein